MLIFSFSHEKHSKWKEASKCYKDVLQLDPKNALATERLAMAHQLMGKEVSYNSIQFLLQQDHKSINHSWSYTLGDLKSYLKNKN